MPPNSQLPRQRTPALSRRLTIVLTIVLTVALGVPVVSAQDGSTPTPQDSAIGPDGEIQRCTAITEPGNYHLSSDFEASTDGTCLTIEHNESSVTIDGNGHTLQGPGMDGTTGIAVDPGQDAGSVEIHAITVAGWGSTGIEHMNGDLTLRDATVTNNGDGYRAQGMNSGTLRNVTFTGNDGAGISTEMIIDLRVDDVQSTGNDVGIEMIDGGDVQVTNSHFTANDGAGISVGHSMNAAFSNVDASSNGGNGVLVAGSSMGTQATFEDSSFTANAEDGLEAVYYSGSNDQVDLTNVHIDENAGRAISTSDTSNGEQGDPAVVQATNVTLGGGLAVDFERQGLTIETEKTDWSATDTMNITGSSETAVDATFDVGGANGQLWQQTDDAWNKQGEYSTSDGRFEATIGAGTWTADSPDSTPTQDATATPSGPQSSGTTQTSPSGGGGPQAAGQTDTATSGTNGPGMQADSDTLSPDTESTPGSNTTGGGNQVNTIANSPTDDPESPAGQPDTETVTPSDTDQDEDGDGVVGDGPGFTGLTTLIILVGAVLLAARQS
ncbi:right-handed parallel beta-helix repeat-containing protein [Natronomonas salina]|uniref:right-handed parallel beta-helix repeat-containing protein n=1 Tax=Natronomonas salina TaxID=1710540 RepID=UPI0015B67FDF|nr:right-handed parallel beta-helix repeat-containing protein [Natronomonas salina]QLD89117.1 right-handed parallel beta-helix repeat-containing protein [Natronomonas salina]